MGRRENLLACVLALLLCAAPGAATAQEPGAQDVQRLESRLHQQQTALEAKISKISHLGERLEEAQASASQSRERLEELRKQMAELDHNLRSQKKARLQTQQSYERAAVAAYKGQNHELLLAIIQKALDSDSLEERLAGSGEFVRVLGEGRETLEAYERSERMLRDTKRQLAQKRQEYRALLAGQERAVKELRRRERLLEAAIGRLMKARDETRARVGELRRAEREEITSRPGATGWDAGARRREMGLVERERVVAEPVGSLPEEGYMRLYREAAREYGFGEDWYVLAAIGRVESGHGRDMGSSAAGALGPMQFLPSTWLRAGVDGDGDGVANIMDPEDAIPAAARYLRDAGAPGDWYAALYAYNHAGWYVRQVLAVAEGYRLLAGDREAGPYI